MDTLNMDKRMKWDNIPLDVLVEIGRHVTELGGSVAAMRATCRHWRDGMQSVATHLQPLGLPYHYTAFPNITSVDMSARGHGHAASPSELAALCAAAPHATDINLTGAYQIAAVDPLLKLKSLRRLTLDRTAVSDDDVATVIPHLPSLSSLSLRECVFLQGFFLSSLESCSSLQRLDLASVGLALHINGAKFGPSLAALKALEVLDLGGNNACDAVVAEIACLPRLRALNLRNGYALSEVGLADLAAGAAGRSLQILDLEGCNGLGEGTWTALSRFSALEDLSLARLTNLLQSAAIPDHAAASLWRWPQLRRLSLAGSSTHPTKLKLLAATCGTGLAELDISCPGMITSSSSPRAPLSRLPPQHIKDLIEAAKSLKQLRVLSAARTGMPLEAAVAFLRGASKLEVLDFSGCCIGPQNGLSRRHAGRLWSSGIFRPGVSPYRTEAANVCENLASPGPEDFALALGSLSALRVLRLDDCGLRPEHLCHLGWIKGLTEVSFAGNRGLGDAAASALVLGASSSSSPCSSSSKTGLVHLNISGTSITDEGLCALAAPGKNNNVLLHRLETLKLARCGPGVSAVGLHAVAAALVNIHSSNSDAKKSTLRVLDLTDAPFIDTACLETIATSFSNLQSLILSGCGAMGGPDGIDAVATLRSLQHLDLSRCENAVTDAALLKICQNLGHLKKLSLDGARKLTPDGISALRMLPLVSEVDLTCCAGLGDDEVVKKYLPADWLKAVVHLPQGGRTVTAMGSGSGLLMFQLMGSGLSVNLGHPLPQI